MNMLPRIYRKSLFDDFFDAPFNTGSASGLMKTDVKATDAGYELEIDVPGIDKENISVQLENGYVTVTAKTEKKNDEGKENGHYIRRERFYGTYSRSFYVGEDVNEEDVKAKYENGTLKLFVPDKEKQPKDETKKIISIEG
ncbi:MAG: Hsp20/alpha crystallin family protein [Clostridia bacterium]|nr:Hsp20/alpha crystallin family protein [Clostridia bacterium]